MEYEKIFVELGPWHRDTLLAHALSCGDEGAVFSRFPLDQHVIQRIDRRRLLGNAWQLLKKTVQAREVYLNTCERPLPLIFAFVCKHILRKKLSILVHNADFVFPKFAKRYSKRWFLAQANQLAVPDRYFTISPLVQRNLNRKHGLELELLPVWGLSKVVDRDTDQYRCCVVIGEIIDRRKDIPELRKIAFADHFSGETRFSVVGNIEKYQGPEFERYLQRSGGRMQLYHGFIPELEFYRHIASAEYILNVGKQGAGYEELKSSAAMFYSRAFSRPAIHLYGNRYLVQVDGGCHVTRDINHALAVMHNDMNRNCQEAEGEAQHG